MRINGKIAKTVLTLSLGSAMAFAQAGSSQNTPAETASGAQAGGGHGQGSHTADHGMSSNKGAGPNGRTGGRAVHDGSRAERHDGG